MTSNTFVKDIPGRIDIDEAGDLITSLLSRYPWEQERKNALQSALDKILERRNRKKLYLGIIGEFSSGKTTFLNAMLEADFLKTHAVQGTTVVTTFIEYGEEIGLVAECHDGASLSYSCNRDALIRLGLHDSEAEEVTIGALARALTTDKRNADIFKRVWLYYPSPRLRKGLVLVDTPGIDSTEADHLEITKQALLEDCDLAVVIIPGGVPLSMTLQTFLAENLPDNLHRCQFLLTKVEGMKNEEEREMVRKNVEKRLSTLLHVPEAKVYPAPTLLLLEEEKVVEPSGLFENIPVLTRQAMVENFKETMNEIFAQLQEKKEWVLSERLISLMKSLLLTLGKDLDELEARYAKEKLLLEKNSIPDIEQYTNKKKEAFQLKIKERETAIKLQLKLQIEGEAEKAQAYFSEKIDAAQSKKEISETINSYTINDYMGKSIARIEKKWKKYAEEISQLYDKLYNEFEDEFLLNYKTLALLGSAAGGSVMNADKRMMKQLKELTIQASGITDIASTAVKNRLELEKITAAIDEFFGSSFLPELEDAIEKFFNFFGSKDLFLSTKSLKQKVHTATTSRVEDYYAQVMSIAQRSLHQKSTECLGALEEMVSRYMKAYAKLVNEMIERDRKRSERLDDLREKTREDQERLKAYMEKLEDLKTFYKTQ